MQSFTRLIWQISKIHLTPLIIAICLDCQQLSYSETDFPIQFRKFQRIIEKLRGGITLDQIAKFLQTY